MNAISLQDTQQEGTFTKLKFSKFFVFFLITSTVISLALYAPRFLAFSSHTTKSDAVVLLIGPDYEARKKEGHRQITEGSADHLLIPAHGTILKGGRDRVLRALNHKTSFKKTTPAYSYLYENTHLEILWTKDMMDGYGLTSAIFVSSPAHMRRIKIIADRVFDPKAYGLSFVPTRHEKPWGYLWWTDIDRLKQVISEYVKIAWFLLYSHIPFLAR